MFDGVHVGHQRLIRRTIELARRGDGQSVVVTFDPDPQQALDPRHAPPQLTSLERRIQLIAELRPDLVVVIAFTPEFARTSPEEFVGGILHARLRCRGIVVGETFAFGRDRQGNLPLLRQLAKRHGMRVVVVPPVVRRGEPVSSSRIRRLVQGGSIELARRLLGRPAELWGSVVRGDRRGRQLGFPTANVQLAGSLLPPRGVYRVWLERGGARFDGLMNLGVRPTFSGSGPGTESKVVCEVHLAGFRGGLYGRRVRIGLLRRIRDERRFDSPEALAEQIHVDLARAGLSAPFSRRA
jgi:riboflavin kinase/FMN adenylyltransferase